LIHCAPQNILIVGPHGLGQPDAEDRHFNSGGHLRPNPFLGFSNYTQRKGAKDAKVAKETKFKRIESEFPLFLAAADIAGHG
jgi:hypothetical protein